MRLLKADRETTPKRGRASPQKKWLVPQTFYCVLLEQHLYLFDPAFTGEEAPLFCGNIEFVSATIIREAGVKRGFSLKNKEVKYEFLVISPSEGGGVEDDSKEGVTKAMERVVTAWIKALNDWVVRSEGL